jgi:hypothetical protein
MDRIKTSSAATKKRWDANLSEERKQVLRDRAKAWYYANKDRIKASPKRGKNRLAWQREYNKQHREQVLAAKTAFRAAKPWYQSWENAKQRCTNTNNPNYKNYGGRGIRFNLSQDDFAFLWQRDNAAAMIKPSIDRIDSDGDYHLANCRFIEHLENSRRGLASARARRMKR